MKTCHWLLSLAGKLCGALTLAATLMLAGAPAGAVPVLTDIASDTNDPSNLDDSEPSIAVSPANPLQIAVVTFSEGWSATTSAPVWKSTDGGLTWAKVFQLPRPAPGSGGPGDQKIAHTAVGNLLVAELAGGLNPPRCFIYRQTAGPNDPLTPGAVYGDDQPHLDADIFGASLFFNRVYSPWLDFSQANERSTVAVSTNFGMAVANVGVGDNSTFPNRTTRIAVAPDGRAFIIYKTREGAAVANFENAHFRVARSDDGGGTWNGLGAGGISIHGATTVQTWFTNTFGNTAKGPVARARSSDAWIATHPTTAGRIYAAYCSRDASGFGQIYVARSTDQGFTWTSTRVTDGTHHSAYPEIAVAANGTIGVLYIDYDDSGTTTIFRHRFARSFTNGANWDDENLQSMDATPLAAVNNSGGFLWGDYEALAARGNTFFGAFTGQSIGRTTSQFDPIFFRETAVPSADLSITKAAAPNPVLTGSNITYTINVTNNGPNTAPSVVVTDILPSTTTFVSCASTGGGVCSGSGNSRVVTFVSLAPGASATITLVANVNCPVPNGTPISDTATVTFAGTDPVPGNNSSTASVIASNPPPVISGVSVDHPVLWPPNHKLQDVTVNYTVTDNCGTPICTLSATSNEPDNGLGDGDTPNDIQIVDAHHVRLRAERSGLGDGRIYTITITCKDSAGNPSSKTVTVTVPKSQS